MIASAASPRRLLRPFLRSRPQLHRNPNGFCFPQGTLSLARTTPISLSRLLLSPLPASPSELPSSEELRVPPPGDGLDSDSDPEPDETEAGDGVEVEVSKVGRNRRRIRARVGVGACMEAVWAVLTDYEGLARFIPSLAVSRLVEKGEGFARLYQASADGGDSSHLGALECEQGIPFLLLLDKYFRDVTFLSNKSGSSNACPSVGLQDLALGLKFQAKGTLDCFEKDLELLPSGRKRDIEFRMVEGDFQTFEGAWSILQMDHKNHEEDDFFQGQEFQTVLSYVVELEPKLWLPVRLLEGRLCREVKTNLLCARDEAQRVQSLGGDDLPTW
ncbi:hypothetical protein Taro_005258 [Colocasia esculenta]|uniref:Coenzyme Q-binding protein COQ10 START domain-containing protein n=1 Tax=Colocasia esculenta TaxID=4460 RepID=A0A843TU58_COLES|nr:hypothetical protein [Colocasia esculenta]